MNDCNDVETLLELAVEAELMLDAEKRYKPPPSPESSLLPEMAYTPRDGRKNKTKVAAFVPQSPPFPKPTTGPGTDTLERFTRMIVSELKNFTV